jgi:hypothetical protein
MKIRAEFNREDDCKDEAFFDVVELTTVQATNSEDWADAMLDLMRASQVTRSAIVAQMLWFVASASDKWSQDSIKKVREALEMLESA